MISLLQTNHRQTKLLNGVGHQRQIVWTAQLQPDILFLKRENKSCWHDGWMDSTQKLDSANVQGLPLLSKRLQAQKGFREHYNARYMICAELQIQFCESTTSSVITSIQEPNQTGLTDRLRVVGEDMNLTNSIRTTKQYILLQLKKCDSGRSDTLRCLVRLQAPLKEKNRRGKQTAPETHKLVYSFAQHFF